MAKSKHYYIRRAHRYMGVILGIQFLFWTISGLYFSWSDLDEIHGDFQHRSAPRLRGNLHLVSPDQVLRQLPKVDSLNTVQVMNILEQPFYSITYFADGKLHNVLAHASTGTIRKGITKEEALQIAAANWKGDPMVEKVEYLRTTHGHHEYREKPLPAWAVTFYHPTHTTVYISAEFGKVEAFRNNKWRLFDFLWMMHTMDYQQRDNINNWLLRLFSLFGLLTIISGFVLYAISSKFFRKRKKRSDNVLLSPIQGGKHKD